MADRITQVNEISQELRGKPLEQVSPANAQTEKQTGRWTKKPPAEGGQKCAKGHETLDSAPAGELF